MNRPYRLAWERKPDPRQQISRGATPARLRAAEKSLARQKASWGLFADQVDVGTPEERIAAADAHGERMHQFLRGKQASSWWRARRWLRRLDPELALRIAAHWNAGVYPLSDPGYLVGLIWKVAWLEAQVQLDPCEGTEHEGEYWAMFPSGPGGRSPLGDLARDETREGGTHEAKAADRKHLGTPQPPQG